jgi:hypothetical protein
MSCGNGPRRLVLFGPIVDAAGLGMLTPPNRPANDGAGSRLDRSRDTSALGALSSSPALALPRGREPIPLRLCALRLGRQTPAAESRRPHVSPPSREGAVQSGRPARRANALTTVKVAVRAGCFRFLFISSVRELAEPLVPKAWRPASLSRLGGRMACASCLR